MIDNENFGVRINILYCFLCIRFFVPFFFFFFAQPSLIKPPYGIYSGLDYQSVGGQGFYI